MKHTTFVMTMAAALSAAALTANAANVIWRINDDIPAGMEDCLAVLVMSGVSTPPTVGWDAVNGTPTLNAIVGSQILAIMPVGDVNSWESKGWEAHPNGCLEPAYFPGDPLWGPWLFDTYNVKNPDLWANETEATGGLVDMPDNAFSFYMIVFHSDTINGIGGSEWLFSDANGTYFEYQVSTADYLWWANGKLHQLKFSLDDWPGGLRSYTEIVPEPASASLLAAGFAVLLLRRRRQVG